MKGRELSLALRKGEYVYGSAILSPSCHWPKVVASTGLDFVFIDTEHTTLNRETVSNMCNIYKALNIAPIVRIPSPDPYEASMVLDGGASGIIAPYIETADQVKELVGAVKFKPLKGKKLQNRYNENGKLDEDLSVYLRSYNLENVLILNIESMPALDSLDEILSVEGVDGVLVGPHDLSCSLGIPEQYDHPLFKESVMRIIEEARQKGVGAGVHVFYESGFEQEMQWAEHGANLIVHSSDILAFKSKITKEIAAIKKYLGQAQKLKENESFNI